MCGIYGYSSVTDITKSLTGVLALYMNDRGNQAWGLTDGCFIHKEKGSIVDCWTDLGFSPDSSLLVHTRQPSCGANTDRNAHPFEFIGPDGHKVIGAHNGHIHNWQELKTKYSATRSACEVDSEMIFASLAERTPLGELGGYGTVVWWEMENGSEAARSMHLSTFERGELSIAKLKTGEVVFASTKSSIQRAIAFSSAGAELDYFYDIKPLVDYQLRDNDLYIGEALDWGKKPLYAQVTGTWQNGRHVTNALATRWCRMPSCPKKLEDPESMLICEACFSKMAADYVGLTDAEVHVWTA